jgi:hypothetical protein
MRHRDRHRSERIGWLRAAVLGANDGIVSTASLVAGVASAASTHHDILLAGIAGAVAGALSMAGMPTSLQRLLSFDRDVVGTAADGRALLDSVAQLQPTAASLT